MKHGEKDGFFYDKVINLSVLLTVKFFVWCKDFQ